jgi:hypothetical protein
MQHRVINKPLDAGGFGYPNGVEKKLVLAGCKAGGMAYTTEVFVIAEARVDGSAKSATVMEDAPASVKRVAPASLWLTTR